MKKLLQLKLYSFLSTRWGMAVFILCIFLSFNSFLQVLNTLLLKQNFFEEEQGNLTRSFENTFSNADCIPEIDIVYTWVNGSDPRQIDSLKRTKRLVKGETLCNSTQNAKDDNCVADEESASRFIDNQELKYSLRSIEKFAPWARHIYLVTNGQVPSWLNISHPRISIITHAQIFQNPDHLPTFSSPAIEANIHRIPNLSKKFIYFNDDTLLGSAVFPDDFYTQSGGQKIFLAWPVPNCNEGCAPGWIGDGYCDLACNVSECQWDAGDCANSSAPQQQHPNWNNFNNVDVKDDKYCSPGCPDSWIGDKFCDRTCRNKECGFDGGDCEVSEIVEKIHGIQHLEQNTLYTLPNEILSAYFNLSNLVNSHKIVDAYHDNPKIIRTATISQKNKMLVLTFKRNLPVHNATITLIVDFNGEERDVSFNISIQTAPPIKEEPLTIEGNNVEQNNDNSISTTGELESLTSIQIPDAAGEVLDRMEMGNSRNLLEQKENLREKYSNWFQKYQSPKELSEPHHEYHSDSQRVSFTKRNLLDMYGDSLKFVNGLLTVKFGPESRRVPSHMPHMIDKDLVEEMQNTWSAEFEATSSHKLRDKHDMQYALSYFYFLMNQKIEFNWTAIWDEYLDTNSDGELDDNEIRNLLVHIKDLPLSKNSIQDFKNEVLGESDKTIIDIELIEQNSQLFDKIKNAYGKKKKNRFQMGDTDEVAFIMVGTNSSDVRKALDGIRRRRQKFVCLNDNINHSNPHSLEVVHVLHQFYQSLFPFPSSFELVNATTNPFLYLDEIQPIKQEEVKSHPEKYPKEQMILFSGGLLLCISCLLLQLCLRILNPGIRHQHQHLNLHHHQHHRFTKILHA